MMVDEMDVKMAGRKVWNWVEMMVASKDDLLVGVWAEKMVPSQAEQRACQRVLSWAETWDL